MNIRRWLKQEFRMYYRRRNWRRFVQTMAMIVVFCTTYALILPALTMETNTVCGLAEHTHAEGCYETASLPECTLPEREAHTHGDACYTQSTVCGKEEQTAHSHSPRCIGPQATLMCKKTDAEHDHVATCYIYETGLTCGQKETQGHSHASDPTDPIMNLVCILAEHTHDDSCYPETEPETTEETTEEPTLPEGDPNADLETPEDWEAGLSAVTFTGGWSEDLLKVARSQLGYGESRENYILDENGTAFGYTRYGQWYGEPYGDWSAMFVSFCLHYAKVEGIGPEQDSQVWLETLNGAEMYREAAAYTPAAGDLIFFDRDFDGVCDRVGIAESVIPAGESGFGSVQVIAGDWNDRVERFEMLLEDASILGYCPLPAKPDAPEHTHSDEAGTQTQVILSRDTTVPADAALTVAAVTEDDAQYAAMAEQIHQALNGTVKQMTLLDISFYDAAGEYLSVSDTAQVSIHFAGDRFPSGMVKVFHFVDGAAVELEKVNVSHAAVAAEDGTESVQTQLTFETNGFSVFAVVEVTDTSDRITVTDPAELAGNSYYIVSNNQNYVMIDSIYADTGRGLDRVNYTGTDSLAGRTTWTFTETGDGTFYIHSNNGYYMVMDDSNDSTAKVSLTTNIDEATEFTVRAINGQAEISYDGPNGIAHYLNVYNGNLDFCGWKDDGFHDDGSKVYLHIAEDVNDRYTEVKDLAGKSFAIVNEHFGYAMVAEAADHEGLTATRVSIQTLNGTKYVSGEGIAVWDFTQDADCSTGEYYISTTVDGSTKYLRLSDYHLTLDDTGDKFAVTAWNSGKVILRANGFNINFYNYNPWKFAGYDDTGNNSQQSLCELRPDIGLFYNLNAPSGQWVDGTTPGIENALQEITADGQNLFFVTGRSVAGTFVRHTLGQRSAEKQFFDAQNTAKGDALTAENYLAPGASYEFLGWQATVNGNTYLFPEGAEAYTDDAGNICITDTNGNVQTVPSGTQLVGQWKMVSNVVLFFVNHGDTMLENEDNKKVERIDSDYYTDIVAIGHIYNPVAIDTGYILKSTHNDIVGEFVPYYDPSNSGTQIVIEAVCPDYGQGYTAVTNFNELRLEASVGSYLRTNTDPNKQILLDKAVLDRSQINEENYKLYWYTKKRFDDDGWHIDGVLVAETQPLGIYKTFSGLTDDETTRTINVMEFPLGLINADGKKGEYTTLTANSSQEGVYTNDGRQGSSHIYKWTLQAVQGQRYAFAEEEYLVDDHDWSGLISVHYTDGIIEYRYNTDGIIEYRYNTDTTYDDTKNTDLFANKPIIGGEVKSVIFANFYTKTGTGMFSVSKVQEDNDRNRLSGAVFTLKDENGQVVATETTNDNGAVHFADLKVGTYTLEETQAPTGYQKVNTKWTVKVSKSGSGVTVEIWEEGKENSKTTLYDSKNGGIKEVYLVENEPESTTVTVNKYFTGITDAEVRELTDYCIEVKDSGGAVVNSLSLSDATPITGAINGYTWTIDLECENDYTFVESSYSHRNYLDTVVTATVNGTAAQVTKSNNNTVASFPMTKSEAADTVNITNDYTNTFLLRIHKVDATDNNADMAGVEFHIYGDFQFHVTPPEGVAATIDYTDAGGSTKQAYYIGTTEETDANGMTQFVDMHLSTGSNSFLYVINEANTPDGYLKLDEPIVRVVEVNGGDPSYNNGVYTLTVENHEEVKATVAVTAEKLWSVPEGMDCPPVTLTLYQKTADGTVTQISQVTLDGTTWETTENGITATVNGWQVVWSGLTYADGDTRNEFYVSESALPGYITTYSTKVSTLKVGTSQVGAAIAEGYNLKRSVTVTNTAGFELPSTGGSGTAALTLSGLAMFLGAAYLLCGERKRRKGKA